MARQGQPPAAELPSPAPGRILDAVTLGVVVVDLEGRITYINSAGAEIIGVSQDQALGRQCSELFQSTLCEEGCPLRKAIETGQSQYNLDAVYIRQGGRSVMPVKVTLSPLRDQEGRVIGGVETIQSFHLMRLMDKKARHAYTWEDFLGSSPAVQAIFDTMKVVAPTNVTVLIEGATGTGKDLLAHIIHNMSSRRPMPFIKVNCAALPENLLESELFGYMRGAFTGAVRDKPGRFQLADKGTIFLDEISEMPLSLQAKLLRVLEEMEFDPLGGRKTIKVDVRVIAACNKPLQGQVEAGLFRADLYYRLNVIRVMVPPLRERREDVPLLIQRFIRRKNVERGTYICRFAPETLDILLNYDYPGNVREMENILEHACLLCRGDIIQMEHLPRNLRESRPLCASANHSKERQRQDLLTVLRQNDWNRQLAAESLGVDRTTLWRRMKRLGIKTP